MQRLQRGGGRSEEKTGAVPNRVKASKRSSSNSSEKQAAIFISWCSDAQQKTINELETLNLAESKVKVYRSLLREYSTGTTGVGHCHLRALYNVSPDAAHAAMDQKLLHKNNSGVHDLLANYVNVKQGRVFRLWDQHWVALKIANRDTKEAMYFDDKMSMKIRNFDGAATVFELMEEMTEKNWIKTRQERTQIRDSNAVSRVVKILHQKPASVPLNTVKHGVGGKGTADDTRQKVDKHKINMAVL